MDHRLTLLLAAAVGLLVAPAAGATDLPSLPAERPDDLRAEERVRDRLHLPSETVDGERLPADPTLQSWIRENQERDPVPRPDLGGFPPSYATAPDRVDLDPGLATALPSPSTGQHPAWPEPPETAAGNLSLPAAEDVTVPAAGDWVPDIDGLQSKSPSAVPVDDGNRSRHPPIVVVGDQGPTGFALFSDPVTGTTVHRPGSGVVAGSGTAQDPYIISGWNVSGIRIRDTSAHVRIVDNRIRDPPDAKGAVPNLEGPHAPETPIVLDDADNVEIVGNTIRQTRREANAAAVATEGADELTVARNDLGSLLDTGVAAVDGTGITVRDQAFHGQDVAVVAQGAEVTVANVTIQGANAGVASTGGADVTVRRSSVRETRTFVGAREAQVTVDDNRITDVDNGVYLLEGAVGAVTDNTVEARDLGVVAVDADQTIVAGNTIGSDDRQLFLGVGVAGEGAAAIVDNTVERSLLGVVAFDNPATVAANTVDAGYVGIWIADADDASLQRNTVDRPIYGLLLDEADGAEVRGNDLEGWYASAQLYDGTEDATLVDNEFGDGYFAATVSGDATENVLADNVFRPDGPVGLYLDEAPGNTVRNNDFASGGILLQGDGPAELRQTIPPTNTVDGDRIHYAFNATDTVLDMSGGQAILAASRNVTVDGPHAQDVIAGAHVVASRNVSVEGTITTNTTIGTLVQESRDVTLTASRHRTPTVGVLALESPGTTLQVPSIEASDISVGVLAFEGNLTVGGGRIAGGSVGLLAEDGATTTLDGTTVEEGEYAVVLEDTIGSRVSDATLDGDDADVLLFGNRNATLVRNDLEDAGLVIYPPRTGLPGHEISASNTVAGDPLRYHEAATNLTLHGSAGQVVLLQPRNVTVRGFDLGPARHPVAVHGGRNLTVDDNWIEGRVGVLSRKHADLTVEDSTLVTGGHGLVVEASPDARIVANDQFRKIPGTLGPHLGVLLLDARGANVTGNDLDQGLYVENVDPNRVVRNNTVEDEPLRYVPGSGQATVAAPAGQVVIAGNATVDVAGLDIEDAGVGLVARGGPDVAVDDTRIASNRFGILAPDVADLTVRDSRLVDNHWGAYLVAEQATFRNALVDGTDGWDQDGILSLGGDLRVDGSTIRHHDQGIFTFFASANVTATNVTENEDGIFALSFDETSEIHRNNIVDNREHGLLASEANATRNWWGCPGGPEEPACDDASVDGPVYPVLQEPNTQAGFDPLG